MQTSRVLIRNAFGIDGVVIEPCVYTVGILSPNPKPHARDEVVHAEDQTKKLHDSDYDDTVLGVDRIQQLLQHPTSFQHTDEAKDAEDAHSFAEPEGADSSNVASVGDHLIDIQGPVH